MLNLRLKFSFNYENATTFTRWTPYPIHRACLVTSGTLRGARYRGQEVGKMSGSPRLGQQRFAKSGKVRDGKRGLTALAICADSYYLISIPFPPCGEVWCVGGVPPRQPHICHGEGPESALKLFRGDACFPAVRSFIHDVARRPNCGTRHKIGSSSVSCQGWLSPPKSFVPSQILFVSDHVHHLPARWWLYRWVPRGAHGDFKHKARTHARRYSREPTISTYVIRSLYGLPHRSITSTIKLCTRHP